MHVLVPIPAASFIFNTTASRGPLLSPPSLLQSCFPTIRPFSFRFSHPPPPLTTHQATPLPLSLHSMAGTAAAATVCSMCGDVGFPEKLFRCGRCRHRFQHSYCTNYYGDSAPASAGSDMCDWCLSDVAGGKQARWPSSSSPAGKQHQHATTRTGSQESTSATSSGGSGSGRGGKQQAAAEAGGRRATTRAAGRRYKLLKDVLCE